jgi:hypothetical protein
MVSSVIDVHRLSQEGHASLLQGFGSLGGVDGEVEERAQIHDGGIQDVLL